MRRTLALCLVLSALGCDAPEAEAPLPRIGAPPSETWPAVPDGVSAEVRRCADDYRAMGREGLPPQAAGTPFSGWYTGAFQTWTDRYNEVRGRCDEIFGELDEHGAAAQVMLAAQSYLHERVAEDAEPLGEEPQMFVLGRYWSLGAACTYQSCGRGPDRAWASLCARRARDLPACPPVEE
ncbi:MAG: hypothetical protein R3B82_13855 [Sandaracinaceae bacterium]